MKILHTCGYAYNSIRLSNILINYDQYNGIHVSFKNFSSCTKLFEKNGQHLRSKKGLSPTFDGDIIFSSLNQQELNSTSRRDDLISLTYLLVYLLNG